MGGEGQVEEVWEGGQTATACSSLQVLLRCVKFGACHLLGVGEGVYPKKG